MSGRGRVCLHAPYLYPLFSDGTLPFAGGAETQQAALARGLVREGFDVCAVTCDYGQPAETVVDGVRLIRSFPPHAGWPGVRFFHPRLTRSVAALRRADADVYYTRGAGLTAGLTFDVARWMGRPFVFAAAHDHDTRPDSPLLHNARDRWWYGRALRGADAVLAQTRSQQEAFAANFGRRAELVSNLVRIPPTACDAGAGRTVVWLSTYKASKRPAWFLELARRLPQHQFVMRGVVPPPPLTRASWDEAVRTAETVSNLEVGGHVPHAALAELYATAALFVHTSPVEGFANTLLEAWSFGIPTIACADPDGLIESGGFGEVVRDGDALAAVVSRWMEDDDARRRAGERARRYVSEHHASEVVLSRLAGVFDGVIERIRARG